MKQGNPPALRHLVDDLGRLEQDARLRVRPAPVADVASTFCSNDYLALAGSTGAGASRLIVGERPEHLALERALTTWLEDDAALVFSSGYAANVGVLSALARPGDLIVSDALNHASIIDGCRLTKARVAIVPHLDLAAIRRELRLRTETRAWVVTESYFGMDADSPDLSTLRSLCDEHSAALVVDEAHAFGVFGPRGAGLCAEAGIRPDVRIGTLGKALGTAGAFVVGSDPLIAWLWNTARSFVFSTGISPEVARTAAARVEIVARADGARAHVLDLARTLRAGLRSLGYDVPGHGPILPVLVGDPRRTLTLAAELRRRGVHVLAIRPPTVPEGSSRLRLTVTAAHRPDDVARVLAAFSGCAP